MASDPHAPLESAPTWRQRTILIVLGLAVRLPLRARMLLYFRPELRRGLRWLGRDVVGRYPAGPPDHRFTMAVTVNDSWPYLLGIYEHALMAYWREHVSVGMTVLDVGGHTGYHAIYLANLVGPTGRVVALEPVHELAQQLATNVGLNQLDNCQVIEIAASDEEAMVELFIPRGDLYSTIATTDPTRAEAADGVVRTVQARPLDSLATTIGPPVHYVKIDVESAEAVALSGATILLADPTTVFVVEVNEWITAESQHVIEMLRQTGRQLDVVGTRGLTAFIAARKKPAR